MASLFFGFWFSLAELFGIFLFYLFTSITALSVSWPFLTFTYYGASFFENGFFSSVANDFLSSPLFNKFFTLLVLMFPEWTTEVSLTFCTLIYKTSRFFLVPVGLVIITEYDAGFKSFIASSFVFSNIFSQLL